jgi:hypothetical protein
MVDYRAKVAEALARQRVDEVAKNSRLDELAGRTPVYGLNVHDVAVTIADALRDQKSEIFLHVGRLLALTETKRPEAARVEVLEDRFRKLLSRVGVIESELRRLQRGGSR